MRSILISAAAIVVFTVILVVAQITTTSEAVSASPLNAVNSAVVADVAPPAGKAADLASEGSLSDADSAYVTTDSGLKYRDIEVGTGDLPQARQLVTVHYTGKLTNGKQFDSSLKRGEPFTFPIGVGRVIKGWDEGVSTMKVGGKRELVIPSNLAYGDSGIPGTIPPKATLVFEVELLDIL